jgi:hypothetical protein
MNKVMLLLIMVLISCTNTPIQEKGQESYKEQQHPQEELISTLNIDGKEIELVSDEYDNYYLKQHLPHGVVIYVPYTFPVEEEEIPRVYEAKY